MRRWWIGTAAVLAFVGTTVIPANPAMADGTRDAEWMLTALDIAEAQKITTGEGVTVGLLDTGVDSTHPDLTGVVIGGKDSWSPGKNGQSDSTGHGTAMASLIAGHGHGDGGRDGVLGVAPGAKILSYGAFKPGDKTYDFEESANGLEWLIDQGVDVIVMAQGGGSTYPREKDLIKEAIDKDIIVVAAAGNIDANGLNSVGAPGNYDGVLTVSGTNQAGELCDNSVYGDASIALAAPCQDVISAHLNGGYGKETGTSNSTAIAAGVVALIKSEWPDISRTDAIRQVVFTADDKGPKGTDLDFGYGLVNPVEAVTREPDPKDPAKPPHRRGDPIYASAATDSADATSGSNGAGPAWMLWAIIGGVVVLGGVVISAVVVRSRRSRRGRNVTGS